MEYFEFSTDWNPEVIGVNNGVMQVEIIDSNACISIDNTIRSKQIKVKNLFIQYKPTPIEITSIKILKKAKLTDFISFGPALLWCPFMVSAKALAILQQCASSRISTFPINITPDPHGLNHYHLVHLLSISSSVINFEKSIFYSGNIKLGSEIMHPIFCYADYRKHKEFLKHKNLAFNDSFDSSLDLFFIDGFGGIYMSQRLKKLFEDNSLTGLLIHHMKHHTIGLE